jgi:hypothetical protein
VNLYLHVILKHISILIFYIRLQRQQHVYSYDFHTATRDIQDTIHVCGVCNSLKTVLPCGRNTQLQWTINIVPQIASDSLCVLERCTEDVQRSKRSTVYLLWRMDRLSRNPSEWLLCRVHLNHLALTFFCLPKALFSHYFNCFISPPLEVLITEITEALLFTWNCRIKLTTGTKDHCVITHSSWRALRICERIPLCWNVQRTTNGTNRLYHVTDTFDSNFHKNKFYLMK